MDADIGPDGLIDQSLTRQRFENSLESFGIIKAARLFDEEKARKHFKRLIRKHYTVKLDKGFSVRVRHDSEIYHSMLRYQGTEGYLKSSVHLDMRQSVMHCFYYAWQRMGKLTRPLDDPSIVLILADILIPDHFDKLAETSAGELVAEIGNYHPLSSYMPVLIEEGLRSSWGQLYTEEVRKCLR